MKEVKRVPKDIINIAIWRVKSLRTGYLDLYHVVKMFLAKYRDLHGPHYSRYHSGLISLSLLLFTLSNHPLLSEIS